MLFLLEAEVIILIIFISLTYLMFIFIIARYNWNFLLISYSVHSDMVPMAIEILFS